MKSCSLWPVRYSKGSGIARSVIARVDCTPWLDRGRRLTSAIAKLVMVTHEHCDGGMKEGESNIFTELHLFFKSNKITVVILSMLWKMELLHIVLN